MAGPLAIFYTPMHFVWGVKSGTTPGIKPRSPSLRGHLIFCYKNEKKKSDITLKNILPLSNMSQIIFLLIVLVFKASEDTFII